MTATAAAHVSAEEELRPLPVGTRPSTRGLHPSTSQLNLSALYGIGGAHRGCEARTKVVLGGVQAV